MVMRRRDPPGSSLPGDPVASESQVEVDDPGDVRGEPPAAGGQGAATRERILDVAESLFAEHGLAGTSVRDIAAEVGLTPASLYNHFAGKQALYEAVLERGVRPLIEILRDLDANSPLEDNGAGLIGAIMDHLGQRPHLPRLVHHAAVTGGEHLDGLARDWIQPLFASGAEGMAHDSSLRWEPSEYPLFIAMWLHLIFGHFALAPLLARISDEDPLSPEGLERQKRFLQKVAAQLTAGPSPSGEQRE